MSAAQNDIYDESNWWTSDQGISAYVLESIKYPVWRETLSLKIRMYRQIIYPAAIFKLRVSRQVKFHILGFLR